MLFGIGRKQQHPTQTKKSLDHNSIIKKRQAAERSEKKFACIWSPSWGIFVSVYIQPSDGKNSVNSLITMQWLVLHHWNRLSTNLLTFPSPKSSFFSPRKLFGANKTGIVNRSADVRFLFSFTRTPDTHVHRLLIDHVTSYTYVPSLNAYPYGNWEDTITSGVILKSLETASKQVC